MVYTTRISLARLFTACTAVVLLHNVSANPILTEGVWKNISPPGLTFTGVQGGGTSFCQGFAFDPQNPSTLYVCTSNFNYVVDGLYKSTDAGSTWARIGRVTNPLWQGADTVLDEGVRIRVDPKNPQHLYCGNGVRGNTLGFWVSNDGGSTFTMPAAFKTLNFLDVYDIAVDPADFNHVLVSFHSGWNGNDAGVLESTDGGTTWISHNPVSGWGAGHSIAFLNNSTTWLLGTQGDGYWRTTNSGTSWTQVTTESIAHGGGQIYYTKAGVLYASGSDKVMRSTNNGATWSEVGSVTFTNSVYGDGSRLYAMSAYANTPALFSTSPETDGLTWTNDTKGGSINNGPFEMALDKANGILYGAEWAAGLWALKIPATGVVQSASGKSVSNALQGKKQTFRIVGGSSAYSPAMASSGHSADLFDVRGKLVARTNAGIDGTSSGKIQHGSRILIVRIQ